MTLLGYAPMFLMVRGGPVADLKLPAPRPLVLLLLAGLLLELAATCVEIAWL